MKMYYLLTVFLLMLAFLVLGGCASSGVDTGTFDKLKARVDTLQTSTSTSTSSGIDEGALNTLKARVDTLETSTSSGIDEETFNTLAARVDTLDESANILQSGVDTLVVSRARLAAIAAYGVWYSEYYALGTYAFESTADFNVQLSNLIAEVGDESVIAVWNNYLVADYGYTLLIEDLPADTGTWTSDQYTGWVTAGTSRADALGQVGGQLFLAMQK